LNGQTADADRLFTDIQSRWPEWYPALVSSLGIQPWYPDWVAHGVVLKAHKRSEGAPGVRDGGSARLSGGSAEPRSDEHSGRGAVPLIR